MWSGNRARIGRILLVLVAVCGGLVLGEFAARRLGVSHSVVDARGLHEFRPDRTWLYGLRPGAEGRIGDLGGKFYRINADGFRDRDFQRAKPDGAYRVVVVGDSIAFGYGVELEDSFAKVLEALANSAGTGPTIEILNLGVSGYNPYTESELLGDVGVGYEPDLVLTQFSINDVMDPTLGFDLHTRIQLTAIPDAAYPDPSRRHGRSHESGLLLRLCRRSSLCSVLDDLRLAWENRSLDPGEWEWRIPATEPPDPEWRWLEERYAEMQRAAKHGGARFAVIAFPFPGQVGGRERAEVQSLLHDMGRRGGWITVDPLPRFRAERERTRAKLFLDLWHPSPLGHRIAAQLALTELGCAGLLPAAAPIGCQASDSSLELEE